MATTADRHGAHGDRGVRRREWRLLAVLGLPTFAYALATTVVTTYLPVLASRFVSSSTVIGVLIAVEGVAALVLALPAGGLSDRWGRLPFVIGATPLLLIALAAVGFVHALGLAMLAVVVFFAAYFIAYEPYRALYPDLLDEEIAGRGQSTQALWRGLGTIVAIGAGGMLLTLGDAVPFVAAACVSGAVVATFLWLLPRHRRRDRRRTRTAGGDLRQDLRRLHELVGTRGDLRAFMLANALWELSLGALKTFIVLYLTKGLGVSIQHSALAVALTIVFIGAASPVSGKLGDRFGTIRVMRVALLVYGAGLLVPFLVTSHLVVGLATPAIAIGGGVVMTLPYALLIPLMDADDHGLTTGLYSVSRGVGTALGPLLAGVAITVLDVGPFASTHGYQATWGVCAAAVLASVPILGLLRERTDAGAPARN